MPQIVQTRRRPFVATSDIVVLQAASLAASLALAVALLFVDSGANSLAAGAAPEQRTPGISSAQLRPR